MPEGESHGRVESPETRRVQRLWRFHNPRANGSICVVSGKEITLSNPRTLRRVRRREIVPRREL